MAYEYNGTEYNLDPNVGAAMLASLQMAATAAGFTGESADKFIAAQLLTLSGGIAKTQKAVLGDKIAEVAKLLGESGEYAKLGEEVHSVMFAAFAKIHSAKDGDFSALKLEDDGGFTFIGDVAKIKQWAKGMRHAVGEVDGNLVHAFEIPSVPDVKVRLDGMKAWAAKFARSNGLQDEDFAIEIGANNRPTIRAKAAKVAKTDGGESGERKHYTKFTVKFGGGQITREDSAACLNWLAQKGAFGADKETMLKRGKPKAEGGEGAASIIGRSAIQNKYGFQTFGIDENGQEVRKES